MQTALSNAFIRHLNESVELPEITMQRYPYPTWMNDPLLTALQSFVGIIIMLSFVYTCINTVKIITTEKEKQLKVKSIFFKENQSENFLLLFTNVFHSVEVKSFLLQLQ